MNDHRSRIEPSVGATEEPMLNSLVNPHSHAAINDSNLGVAFAKKVGFTAVAVLGIVVGWHYFNHLRLESAMTYAANEYLAEHLPNASATVNINPVSNLALIRVERRPNYTAILMALIEDALVEGVRQELEPQLERQLSVNARAAIDFYAMILPYQVSIVVGQASAYTSGGWPAAMTSEFVEGCVQGIIVPARRDYYAAARRAGNSSPAEFPEQKLREFVGPACACYSKEASKKWSDDEFKSVSFTHPDQLEALMTKVSAPNRCNAESIVDRMQTEWN